MENTETKWVLVADDDPILREVAASSLRQGGFSVDLAENGTNAMHKLSENTYDLALIDLDMPGADGFEVIHHLRKHGVNPYLPAIVVTGHDDFASIEKAYSVGATSFLSKPINWNLLHQHVKYILRSSSIESELRAAREQAESASRMKSEIFSVLTHELKTPVHTLMGFSKLITPEKLQAGNVEEIMGYTSYIRDSAMKLNKSLSDMSYYFRALVGELKKNEGTYSINELLNSVGKNFEQACLVQGCFFEIMPGTCGNEELICDREMIMRALVNLLSNSLKFTGNAGRIVLRATHNNVGGIALIVEDNGCGMNEKEIRQSTRPLSQADMSHNRQGEGMGMGLSVTKKLVEAHGGALFINSKPDQGTQVVISLPAERLKPATTASANLAR